MIYIYEPYRILRKIRILFENILSNIKYFSFLKKTRNHEQPITLKHWYIQKVKGSNSSAYWPMHPSSQVSYQHRVVIGKTVNPGYQPGCYIHGVNGVIIGDYTWIAPNVGIMSGNHDITDLQKQTSANPIKIGNYCWLGMNSVIMPNVVLGDYTIVGAGSIVTKSFPEGYCIIAGNPAIIIRELDKKNCNKYEVDISYIGYIPIEKYNAFRKSNLEF